MPFPYTASTILPCSSGCVKCVLFCTQLIPLNNPERSYTTIYAEGLLTCLTYLPTVEDMPHKLELWYHLNMTSLQHMIATAMAQGIAARQVERHSHLSDLFRHGQSPHDKGDKHYVA